MNENIRSSFYYQQDTITHTERNSDSMTFAKKESNVIKSNTNKSFVTTSQQSIINLNNSQDSTESRSQFNKLDINNKSLIDNYININLLSINHDSNCYIVNKQIINPTQPVFYLEKKESKAFIKNDFIIKEKINVINDWTIIPILLGILLMASIVVRYSKYLGVLFESIVYRFSSNKTLNEKNNQFKRLTLFLDILFIISFALTVEQIVKGLGYYIPSQKFQFIVFIALMSLMIAYRIFQLIVFKISALFSNHQNFFKDLFNSASLYTRTLGIFLLPLVFLVTYSTGIMNIIFIYISIFTIFIMLILRLISMFRAFILGGFSIFYFILYLCALEIVPLLIILKEVKSR